MKKKNNSFSQNFPPVKINIDDIIRIIEIIETNCNNVEINIDDYVINEKKELYEIPKEIIKKIEIKSSNPYISITFDKSSIRIYMAEASISNRGIFDAVRDIIQKNQLKSWKILKLDIIPVILLSLAFFITFGVIKISSTSDNVKKIINLAAIFCDIISIAWILLFQNIQYRNYTRIYIKNNKKDSNIISRKKDDIIIAIISGIIGLITGYIVK